MRRGFPSTRPDRRAVRSPYPTPIAGRTIRCTRLNRVDIPIGEISRMGGFAEANSLTRAVKSWVGMSPTEYRQHIADQQF